MGQEFVIKNTILEDKVNQLLPSQGGAQAGVDLSASTMIVPVVNLTEAAEGSVLRQDLQSAFGYTGLTHNSIVGATNTVIINTTGYYRVFGQQVAVNTINQNINMFDGTTAKIVIQFNVSSISAQHSAVFDFIVLLKAGESLRATSNDANNNNFLSIATRQLADINGTLVNP
jgi:hypothetical protein